jgi:hypothetical protein
MVGEGGAAESRTRVRIGIELRFLHVYCFLIFEIHQVKQVPNSSLSYAINFSLVEMGQNYLRLSTACDPSYPRRDLGKRMAFAIVSKTRQPLRSCFRRLCFESRDLRAAPSTLYVLTHLLANPSKARTAPY